ncbi:YIP1 family protein [Archangium violaceum]|uniref:YIP1 family protein n=1 Tax=Archangium violaceum TaxID=83451 RepID=UPI00194F9B9D|nr:YIP1 family protein [Archangium violaceum]QRN93411.1 YIP1 family protein [Archangium violaceum]
MSSIAQPARVLLDPLDATGAAVEARRWLWPLLLLVVCVSASGTAFSLRWNAGPAVVQELQMSGRLDRLTETEVSEEIQTASRKALVAGIAKGVFVMPMLTLLLAAALWVFAWLFDRSAPFGGLMSVAALAMMPIALYHLIFTVCALAQHSLSLERVPELVPASLAVLEGLSPKMKKVLGAVDFFNLWSVGLMGLGFSSATGMRKGRALLLCLALYLLFVGVFSIGLPAMMAGEPGGRGGPGGGR